MRITPILVLCSLLSACAYDPIDKPGTWRMPPKGLTSNDENLRAMLADPRDIVGGRGENSSIGVTSAAAVRRQLTNKRFPLPASATSRLSSSQPSQTPNAGSPSKEE